MEPKITVSSIVETYEDPDKVVRSIKEIFPCWIPNSIIDQTEFPSTRDPVLISGAANSLDVLLSIVRDNRTLDTALDSMAMDSSDKLASFSISRQSASIGKISFTLGERPLGGNIEVSLEGAEVGLWLEQQTWHSGRDTIPRSIGDENSMGKEGFAAEWFDGKGRRTMNLED